MIKIGQAKNLLIKVIKENNLRIKNISKESNISEPSLHDFLRSESDVRYKNLGSYGYYNLRDFLKKYG